MKKITLLTLAVMLSSTIFAQRLTKNTDPLHKAIGNIGDINNQTQKLRRGIDGYSGWFNHVEIIDAICADPANLRRYISIIDYDSSLVVVGTTSTFHVGRHSIGTVVDPTDPDWFEKSEPIAKSDIFNEHSKYTFDSIQFTYLYVRNADSVMVSGKNEKIVDTLFVQYFLRNHFRTSSFGEFGLSPDSLNVATGLANNYVRIDTVLLDESDSTIRTSEGWRSKNMRLAVEISNNLPDGTAPVFTGTHSWKGLGDYRKSAVGYNMVFKGMKPRVMGDTLYAIDMNTPIANKYNYFGYTNYIDENPKSSQVANTGHYNGSFACTKGLRYGDRNSNNWKHYIQSRAFFEKQYQFASFKLTTKHNSSVNEINSNGYGVDQVYPNPTKGWAYVNISLKKANNVKVNIFNVSGQKVLSNSNFATAGNSLVKFNTESLAKGIYLANITIDGNSFTRKFIVE